MLHTFSKTGEAIFHPAVRSWSFKISDYINSIMQKTSEFLLFLSDVVSDFLSKLYDAIN